MSLPKLEQTYSYADYITWNENERWELFEGMPVMQASPSRIHQEISGNIFAVFHNFLSGKPCKVYHAPFSVRLDSKKKDKDIKNVVEPDISVICDHTKLDDKGCKGAPDLIIEISSPSTGKIDKYEKFNLYEKYGVKFYWIVEPEQKLLTVFTLQSDGKYGRPDIYSDTDIIKVSLFDDFDIDLKSIFTLR